MPLTLWGERWASVEANHFNPAYCGILIYEFLRSYERARGEPPSFALVFCALPIALHPATRHRLPKTTVTGLLPWLEKNGDVRVGYSERARNLAPYVKEAFMYAIARRAVSFRTGGAVTVGPKRASFTDAALVESTPEIRDTVDSVRKIGRWFAAAGDTVTILAAWGVRV